MEVALQYQLLVCDMRIDVPPKSKRKFTPSLKVWKLKDPRITKKRLFKYIDNFTSKKKNENFQMKSSDIFHVSAQNIDCVYSLEPPLTSSHNMF